MMTVVSALLIMMGTLMIMTVAMLAMLLIMTIMGVACQADGVSPHGLESHRCRYCLPLVAVPA